MVYDIDAERRTLSINGHSDDSEYSGISSRTSRSDVQPTPYALRTSPRLISWYLAQTTATSRYGIGDRCRPVSLRARLSVPPKV